MYERIKKAAQNSELGSLYALAKKLGLNPTKNSLKGYFKRSEKMVKKLNDRLKYIGLKFVLIEINQDTDTVS